MILKECTAAGRGWNEDLALLDERDRDIYFTEEYVKLYENKEDRAACFVYKREEDVFLFPYLKRPVRILGGDFYDFETPYGYSGPVSSSSENGFIKEALSGLGRHALENKIIGGMVRFHPLLGNHLLLKERYDVRFDRNTVAMDLTLAEDAIWQEEVHSKHRNSITKAAKAGLSFYMDTGLEHYRDFVAMYRDTMARIKADSFYNFSGEYFDNMKRLGAHLLLGLVFLEKTMIAGAIFLKYGRFGHYHLAGSAEDANGLNPNNFLIYNAALYLKRSGVKILHLGGGTDNSPDNKLFRFKARFSQQRYPFYIGKIIFNTDMYKKACALWDDAHPDKRQAYRDYILKYRLA